MKKILVLALSVVFAFGAFSQENALGSKLTNAAERSVDLLNDLIDNTDDYRTPYKEKTIKPKVYLAEGEYHVFVNNCLCTLEIYSDGFLSVSYDTPEGKVLFIEGYIYRKELLDEDTWCISYTDNGLYSFNLEYLWSYDDKVTFELY